MKHEREFQTDQREVELNKEATIFQECFGTAAGKLVLEHLQLKFGLNRRRFDPREPDPSPIRAAMIEGECNVIREIMLAINFNSAT